MTLENLLKTALLPIGNTMYIYGGGWNEEDTGAGIEAMTILKTITTSKIKTIYT